MDGILTKESSSYFSYKDLYERLGTCTRIKVFFDKELTQKYLQAFVKKCFNWRLLSILQLKVLNPFSNRRHTLAIMIKDRNCFILSSIVIISLKPMLSCCNSSFLSLLSSSVEISLTWSLAISGFSILLMMSSLTRCRQSILNSLIIGSDVGTFSSKLAYCAADIPE